MNLNIIALPRSGHSAIMFWLLNQIDPVYMGDVGQLHDKKLGYSWQQTDNSIVICPHHKRYKLRLTHRNLLDTYLHLNKNAIFDWQAIDFLHPNLTEKSIIVLRDWYNNLASLIKHTPNIHENTIQQYYNIWEEQAKFIYKYKPIHIIYNKWINSQKYRKKITQLLGLPFNDYGFYRVPHNGSGSSFDGTSYDFAAHKMQTTSRWKHLEESHKKFITKRSIDLSRLLCGVYAQGSFYKYNPILYRFFKFVEKTVRFGYI